MRQRYAHVLATVFNRPWAIERATLDIMARVVLERIRGEKPTDDEIAARIDTAALSNGERIGRQDVGGVAVIPVYGVIAPRMSLMLDFSGGTSLEELGGAIDEAVADPNVKAVVLDIDSPGGSVEGLAEFATYLRNVRDQGGKQIVAIANYTAASAAYYIAAQAHEIIATPSAMVGAVGTIARHIDYSRAEDAEGITTTLITSSNAPYKAEGNPHEPLTDDARGEIQRVVNHFGALFVNDVAKGRGIPVSKVTSDFGQGRMLLPADAQAAGMIDGIGTLEQTVRRLAKRPSASRSDRAAFSPLNLAAISAEPAVEADEDQSHDPQGDAQPPTPLPVPAGVVTRTPAERIAAWGGASTRRH